MNVRLSLNTDSSDLELSFNIERYSVHSHCTENPNQLSYYVARNFVILNDYDQALSYLDKSYELRELPMVFLKVDPILDPLRNEPRFKALLKKMNLE